MEQKSIDKLSWSLVKTKLRLTYSYRSFLGFSKAKEYLLPDSAYGEWLVYEGRMPRFYFKAFDDSGVPNSIAEYADKNNIEVERLLTELLKSKGYRNINFSPKGALFSAASKGGVEDVELLELVTNN